MSRRLALAVALAALSGCDMFQSCPAPTPAQEGQLEQVAPAGSPATTVTTRGNWAVVELSDPEGRRWRITYRR